MDKVFLNKVIDNFYRGVQFDEHPYTFAHDFYKHKFEHIGWQNIMMDPRSLMIIGYGRSNEISIEMRRFLNYTYNVEGKKEVTYIIKGIKRVIIDHIKTADNRH